MLLAMLKKSYYMFGCIGTRSSHRSTSLEFFNSHIDIKGHIDDGPNHLVAVTTGGVLEALLNDVRSKLVLGEIEEVGLNLFDKHSSISIPPVLHDKLNYVVAVAVLYKIGTALT